MTSPQHPFGQSAAPAPPAGFYFPVGTPFAPPGTPTRPTNAPGTPAKSPEVDAAEGLAALSFTGHPTSRPRAHTAPSLNMNEQGFHLQGPIVYAQMSPQGYGGQR